MIFAALLIFIFVLALTGKVTGRRAYFLVGLAATAASAYLYLS